MDWAEDAARIFPEPPLPVYFIYIKLSAAYSAKRGWPTFTRGLRAASARRFCKISTSLMPSSCLSFDVARILPEPPRPEDCGVCEREGGREGDGVRTMTGDFFAVGEERSMGEEGTDMD